MKKPNHTNCKTLPHYLLFILFVALNSFVSHSQFSQNVLSESWVESGGQGFAMKNATITDAQRVVYVAGSTNIGINNTDILVQKISPDGDLVWQQSYGGSANLNDAATDIFVDVNSNVYVTGTIVNTINNGQDLIVLKYNSAGNLQWSYTFHGSNININDAGTAITGDQGGTNVYVTGGTGDDVTEYDFCTISLDCSSGLVNWIEKYDYNSLIEVPKLIYLNGNSVFVSGASQDNQNHWEIATVEYDLNSGNLNNVERSNSNTVSGIDEINDYALDNSGNIYLVGSIDNGTDFDLALYKLDANLNIVWDNYYDISGLDDKGKGIRFSNGAIYLTGSSTHATLGTQILVMKLNPNGTILWQKEFGGEAGLDDSGEKIVIDANNKIYVAAAVNNGFNIDYGLYCLDDNGELLATTSYNGVNNLNDVPQVMDVDLDNNIIITGTEQINSTTQITKTIKYSLFERNYAFALNGSEPSHLQGSILVRFKPDKMNSTTMSARKFHAGILSEFVDDSTIIAMYLKTGLDWSKYNTYKVLRNTTPADSLSITRLGDTIKADNLWTYLSIDIPTNLNHVDICDSLKTLYNYIRDADLDVLFELHSSANDANYNLGQLGLYPNSTYPGADINVENAWDLEVGQFNVKVGVMDAVVHWDHEEFNNGVANIPGPTQKIGGGFNYLTSNPLLYDLSQQYDHGTKVAGIIGAQRNNYAIGGTTNALGIAGIAGGDNTSSVDNKGVQLYPMVIFNSNGVSSFIFSPFSVIANAIVHGYSNSPTNPYHLGLNLINGSWGTVPGTVGLGIHHTFLDATMKECWRNHCVFVSSRGAHDINNGGVNTNVYPACGDDRYLINAMASGNDGDLNTQASYNGDLSYTSNSGMSGINNTPFCPADLMAPGTVDLVSTTALGNTYSTFSHPSSATAHITGVASLMYSKHNIANIYPNNLATEDIEAIMEKTASNQGQFAWETGYGLLNAHEAVKQVSDPYYVKHLTALQTWSSPVTVNATIYSSGNVPPANYPNSKRYLVNWNIDEYLPNGHEIIDWWEFEAATRKGSNYNTSAIASILPVEVVNTTLPFNPIGGNHVQKTAQMATYLINVGNDNNSGNDFWHPMSPADLKYYFSIHVKKTADASIQELEKNNEFMLFPNPAENNIRIHSQKGSSIDKFQIIDVSGRILTDVDLPLSSNNINISNLSKGVYYVIIYSKNNIETKTFVKQ